MILIVILFLDDFRRLKVDFSLPVYQVIQYQFLVKHIIIYSYKFSEQKQYTKKVIDEEFIVISLAEFHIQVTAYNCYYD